MQILSTRRGFLADHSSTSYEFLAIDKPLDRQARGAVSRLSSRANPTSRRVSFVYHVEGYDIPGGWEALMAEYYDVMYSESYDWWTLAVAFDSKDEKLAAALRRYDFRGMDDLGVDVSSSAGRIVVAIHCRLDAGAIFDAYRSEDWDEEEEGGAETGDPLLALLARVRERLMAGDFSPLYAVWEQYGDADEEDEEDSEVPPKPERERTDPAVGTKLAGILD